MNWLDFFASLIGSVASLAWPAALVTCVWMFRGEIRPLIPRLRLKHKDTEISFRLDEAEKVVEHLPVPTGAAPETPEELTRFEQVARLSPRAAITELRREIEGEVRSLAGSAQVPMASKQPVRQLIRIMRENEVISGEVSSLLDDLLTVGNTAAHANDRTFTTEEALRYRDYTDRLIDLLAQAHIQQLVKGG